MSSSICIEQKGVVVNISNGIAKVNIETFSACASCHSKSLCGMVNGSARNINVPVKGKDVSIGEHVSILMKRSLGIKASVIAYIIPFVLIIIVLLLLNALGISEIATGLISLLVPIVYFSVLYLMKDRLSKTFTFEIIKEE